MAGQEEVTYESLVNRWKKELRSSQLAKLDAGFYAALDEHLRALQADHDREYQVNSQSAKAMILQDELRNLQKAREDLYELREKKILMAALAAARGGNPDRSALTRGENDLFEDLVRVLKESRREILRRGEREHAPDPAPAPAAAPAAPPLQAAAPLAPPAAPPLTAAAPAGAAPDGAPPAAAAPPQAPAAPAAEPAAAAAAAGASPAPPAARSNRVLVRVLEDVAPFTGSDLRTYRLSREDVVAVPRDVGNALVQRGKASVIRASA